MLNVRQRPVACSNWWTDPSRCFRNSTLRLPEPPRHPPSPRADDAPLSSCWLRDNLHPDALRGAILSATTTASSSNFRFLRPPLGVWVLLWNSNLGLTLRLACASSLTSRKTTNLSSGDRRISPLLRRWAARVGQGDLFKFYSHWRSLISAHLWLTFATEQLSTVTNGQKEDSASFFCHHSFDRAVMAAQCRAIYYSTLTKALPLCWPSLTTGSNGQKQNAASFFCPCSFDWAVIALRTEPTSTQDLKLHNSLSYFPSPLGHARGAGNCSSCYAPQDASLPRGQWALLSLSCKVTQASWLVSWQLGDQSPQFGHPCPLAGSGCLQTGRLRLAATSYCLDFRSPLCKAKNNN